MLSKVLAGVLAVAVLTVGGYAYWQNTDGSHCCGTQPTDPVSATDYPDCCQEPSRASCCPLTATDAPACCQESAPAEPEVLAIAPRELK
jgi:hypothetical protein